MTPSKGRQTETHSQSRKTVDGGSQDVTNSIYYLPSHDMFTFNPTNINLNENYLLRTTKGSRQQDPQHGFSDTLKFFVLHIDPGLGPIRLYPSLPWMLT